MLHCNVGWVKRTLCPGSVIQFERNYALLMAGVRKRGRPPHPDVLTPAEWRVAKATRFGLPNREIARRMHISAEAVKFHLANIYAKLGMAGRQELLIWEGMPAPIGEAEFNTNPTEEIAMTPIIPTGFTQLFPYIFAQNARAYLDFLTEGLDGEIVDIHASDDGIVRNAHIRFGDTTIMVSEATDEQKASQGTYYLYVTDADAAMANALEAGGREIMPAGFRPYGERQGGVRDIQGNVWWLSQRLAPGGYGT